MDEITVVVEPVLVEMSMSVEPQPEIEVKVEGTLTATPLLPDLLTFYELSKI